MLFRDLLDVVVDFNSLPSLLGVSEGPKRSRQLGCRKTRSHWPSSHTCCSCGFYLGRFPSLPRTSGSTSLPRCRASGCGGRLVGGLDVVRYLLTLSLCNYYDPFFVLLCPTHRISPHSHYDFALSLHVLEGVHVLWGRVILVYLVYPVLVLDGLVGQNSRVDHGSGDREVLFYDQVPCLGFGELLET